MLLTIFLFLVSWFTLARLKISQGTFPLQRSRLGQWGLWTHLVKIRPPILSNCLKWLFLFQSLQHVIAVLLGLPCRDSFGSLRIRFFVIFSRNQKSLLRLHNSPVSHTQCSAAELGSQHQSFKKTFIRSKCSPCPSRSSAPRRQTWLQQEDRERPSSRSYQLCLTFHKHLVLVP